MFKPPRWLLGVAFTLESLRRGYIGGSALSLFIIKEFGLDRQAVPTINSLRVYLALEEPLLSQIPDFLSFLTNPFTDYHEAAKLYLEIIDILAREQRPPDCQFYHEGEN